MTHETMKKHHLPASLYGMMSTFALAASCSAAIVVSESFDGSGGALHGSSTDSGPGLAVLTWTAGAVFLDNGAVSPIVANATGQSAFLPYTFESGKIYTLSAQLLNDSPEWIAVGFSTDQNDTTAQANNARHAASGAYAWALTRNNPTGTDQEAFNGPNTTGTVGAASGDLADPTQPITIDIVLNTENPTWTASYFYNGVQYGETQDLGGGAAAALTGFGFSRTATTTASTSGTLQSLTLAVVPEPATALLGAFGALGLLRRRRP